ncbi:MAG: hypothetical protein ACYTGV_08870 [Planctomycetota bacterium]|jgi:hypothetical protein
MSSTCPEFERIVGLSSVRKADLLNEHVEQCTSCREQARRTDRELRELFDGTPALPLSRQFNTELRRRLATEGPARARRCVLVMRIYWLAVAVISALLITRPGGPELLLGPVGRASLLVFAACLTFPILVLGHRMNLGFFDLIARTVGTPDRRPG